MPTLSTRGMDYGYPVPVRYPYPGGEVQYMDSEVQGLRSKADGTPETHRSAVTISSHFRHTLVAYARMQLSHRRRLGSADPPPRRYSGCCHTTTTIIIPVNGTTLSATAL